MGDAIFTRRFSKLTKKVISDGLILYVDPGNAQSYPGSGTTMFDLSPSGFNGTIGNGVTYSSQFGGVLNFPNNGLGGYVNFGTALNRANNSPFTIQMFLTFSVVPSSTQSFFCSVGTLNGGSPYRYMFSVYPSFNTLTMYNGNDWVGNKSFNFALNTWYNLVITYNGSVATFYLNGVQLSTSFSYSYSGTTSYITNIGGYSPSEGFRGLLGPTLYYNRALSSQEVLENFEVFQNRY